MGILMRLGKRNVLKGVLLVMWLLASFASQLAQAADRPVERLIYGDTVTHVFTSDISAFQFSFDAVTGDSVTLTAVGKPDKTNGPVVDSSLSLFDPAGQLIAQNDDSLDQIFGLTNARLTDFPIPANGLYGVRVTRNQQAMPNNGAVVITIKAKTNDQSRGIISFTQSAHGTISSTLPLIRYAFHAQRGDVVISQVKGLAVGSNLALSPKLSLLDPTNTPLLSASTTKSTVTALSLAPVLIAADDVYTLAVSRSLIDRRTLSAGFDVSIARDRSGIYMAYGDKLTGEITSIAPETQYLFQGSAGDRVTLTMITQDTSIVARLNLRTETDKSLISAQNSGRNGLKVSDAQINSYRLSAAGIYVIVAGRASGSTGTTEGGYTLQLDLVKAGS